MNENLVRMVALAIYKSFSREKDPRNAERRFNLLKEATRAQFDEEAKAAIKICQNYLYEKGEL